MPDQLLRAGLITSDRWLDLPNDTDRLAFVALLVPADDFGNLEGGIRKLWRFLQPRTRDQDRGSSRRLPDAPRPRRLDPLLPDRRKDFCTPPRFRSMRSYLVRKCPPSPWCTPEKPLGKHVRKVINQGHAKNLPVTLPVRNEDVLLGVGVGVGVEVSQKRTSTASPVDNFQPVDKSAHRETAKALTWAEHWKAQGKAFGIEAKQGEASGDDCRRVQEFAKSRSSTR